MKCKGVEMKKVLKFDRPSGPRVLSTILLSHRLRGCTCQQKLDTKLKKLGIKIEYLYKAQ